MRRGPLLIPLVLLVMLLGACAARIAPGSGGGDEPDRTLTSAPDPTGTAARSAPATPGALPGPVTVVRGGGIAGLKDTVVVQPDGAWRRTAAVGRGRDSAGTLTAGQLAELTALATDPALAREAGHTAVSSRCADSFSYAVEVGTTTVRYVDCPGDAEQPVTANKIARLLLGASGT